MPLAGDIVDKVEYNLLWRECVGAVKEEGGCGMLEHIVKSSCCRGTNSMKQQLLKGAHLKTL